MLKYRKGKTKKRCETDFDVFLILEVVVQYVKTMPCFEATSTQALRYAMFEQEKTICSPQPFQSTIFLLMSNVLCAMPVSRPAMQSPMQPQWENECHGLKAQVVQLERRTTNAVISLHQLL
jgi:hypothetical protein